MPETDANQLPWYERTYDILMPVGLDAPTKASCIIILIMFIFSIATYTYDQFHAHYAALFDINLLRIFFGVWVLYRLSLLISYKYLRQICGAFCFTLFCIVGSYIAAGAVSITPSLHLLNWSLLHADLNLGFHQLSYMNWTHQHPWLVSILHKAYDSWWLQFLFVPMILALYSKTKEISTWTLATLMAIFIGGLIYFIFPSSSPASVMYSPYFPASCYTCIAHFYAFHHMLDIPSNGCGLVDFPSFHVIDAVLNTLAFRRIKLVLIPMLILNTLLIASTLLLGFHFLVDVIAGFAIAFFTYLVAQWIANK